MADAIDLGIPRIGPATPLDRGGSAYVYLAEQEDFGRKVRFTEAEVIKIGQALQVAGM